MQFLLFYKNVIHVNLKYILIKINSYQMGQTNLKARDTIVSQLSRACKNMSTI